ncbi:MAG: hypothetical protein OHK0052_12780 [Anaerolineales bacterium]
MQGHHKRAFVFLAGLVLLWVLSAQLGESQMEAQAAAPQTVAMQKLTPTPYVPPAEQGGSVNLVCGAAVLVIIIVGGVVWTQRFSGAADDLGTQESRDTGNENPSGQPTP